MLVMDVERIKDFLSEPGNRYEAEQRVAKAVHEFGEDTRFGILQIATSPTTTSWVFVSIGDAVRYKKELQEHGLTAEQVRSLIAKHSTPPSQPEVVNTPLPSMTEPVSEPSKYSAEYAKRLYEQRKNDPNHRS